jgi:hypothetical protein
MICPKFIFHPATWVWVQWATVESNGHATRELIGIQDDFLSNKGNKRAIPHISHCAKGTIEMIRQSRRIYP